MNIVFLDRNTIGDDVDESIFRRFGDLRSFPLTDDREVTEIVRGADIIIANKARLNRDTLRDSKVRLICLTATGVDNVDLPYCVQNNIAVCNLKGYSTESVVQHTFAMLFSLVEHMPFFHDYTRTKGFVNDFSFRHLAVTFHEIQGKNFGIIGMGAIGRRVAAVAEAFGCHVFYWSSEDRNRCESYPRLDFDTLLRTCDIISIHSPLTSKTRRLFGSEQFKKMKKDAVLLNLGRGDIIIEEDLADAIENAWIGGAAIDVLSKEPMSERSPLIRILDNPRFLVTPHIAWAAVEARNRCMQEIYANIEAFLKGDHRNRVDTNHDLIL